MFWGIDGDEEALEADPTHDVWHVPIEAPPRVTFPAKDYDPTDDYIERTSYRRVVIKVDGEDGPQVHFVENGLNASWPLKVIRERVRVGQLQVQLRREQLVVEHLRARVARLERDLWEARGGS